MGLRVLLEVTFKTSCEKHAMSFLIELNNVKYLTIPRMSERRRFSEMQASECDTFFF